jgi:hypothetical protein
LKQVDSSISVKTANELTHNMYQIIYTLPDSRIEKKQILKMDAKQQELYEIVTNACWVARQVWNLSIRKSNDLELI